MGCVVAVTRSMPFRSIWNGRMQFSSGARLIPEKVMSSPVICRTTVSFCDAPFGSTVCIWQNVSAKVRQKEWMDFSR